MTKTRFRHKQIGYVRWRCRTARRRALLLSPPLAAPACQAPDAATWRRTMPAPVPMPLVTTVLYIGKFIVGEIGDPQLQGHPDIIF